MSCCIFNMKCPSLIFIVSLALSRFIFLFSMAYAFCISVSIYLLFGGWRFIRNLVFTLPRDLHALRFLISLKLRTRKIAASNQTIYDLYRQTVRLKPTANGFLIEDQKWTFQQLLDFIDRVAAVFHQMGIKKGDRIGLLMESHPIYPALWLAATKLGAATGLLNFSLKQRPLQHSLNELKPKLLISSVALMANLEGIEMPDKTCQILTIDDRTISPDNYQDKSRSKMTNFEQLIAQSDGAIPPRDYKASVRDVILFIYTSGTTGLPKAAVITFARYLLMTCGPNHMLRMRADKDIIYNPLPLYHTAGGITGVGQHIVFGMTLAIRRKFSASQFWQDCIKFDATIMQYIGEICRYLLVQPHKPEETAHKVRLAYGNGVRPQVWTEFVERFKVAQIGEFYGATESNANFVNSENRVGAIGFSSVIAPWAYPVYLVKTDPVTEEAIRDPATGLCVPCDYNEVGQLIGAIKPSDPARSFDGYTNAQASSKKIISNVFKQGDQWFLSGDLLLQDDLGFYYFRDRLGDTFRWRGENVSTNEVEAVISCGLHLQCCVVYGVEVPNCEGKAGMLALAMDSLDHLENAPQSKNLKPAEILKKLADTIQEQLPSYAQPIFVRFVKQLDTTGTFKMRKVDLVKLGFNPKACSEDQVYNWDAKSRSFQPLTQQIFDDIQSGKIRI